MISLTNLSRHFWGEERLEATLHKYYIVTAYNKNSKTYETNVFLVDPITKWYKYHEHRYIALDRENARRWHYKAVELASKK